MSLIDDNRAPGQDANANPPTTGDKIEQSELAARVDALDARVSQVIAWIESHRDMFNRFGLTPPEF
jgi:hypothetical protein